MMVKLVILFYFSLLFVNSQKLYSKTIFVYNNNENKEDTVLHKYKNYDYKLLKLALDKTIPLYGEYELIPSEKMNKKRAIYTAKENKIKNFILNASASDDLLLGNLIYANVPTQRGSYGYRIAFISPNLENHPEKYDTLEKIKNLIIGQGVGWLDIDILKFHNFNVISCPNNESTCLMLAKNRIDIYLQGILQVKKQLERNKEMNLRYEKSFLIYYPLPKFFFTHKSNKAAIKRIEEGLKMAFDDGSFNRLFNIEFKKNMSIINMKNMKIYRLTNPYIRNFDSSYEKYNIKLENYR
ncbi:hypothetical protein [Halarcobacter ebronensis]|uniref:Solute-binding protein family 3/N-terminal domain-containing protein n=1 Tax=Halarcobacter ebronensis TaxID=1462615 RepID=A0A4Q1AQJ1_9BACT|nr:hypothetical protein [Halarcobacter ebronensis]QKF81644.1 hypothetical protein AEBR_1149 [Halarcobacter ebronensis]RXK05568.1 hypothetical protein CRV07_08655 [Halarcobacter ebronensis]